MKAVGKRLARLESQWVDRNRRDPKKTFRLVVRHIGRTLDNSSCKRTLTADGFLSELVHLSGSQRRLSDSDLEKFVESVPIERVCHAAS